MTRRLPLVLLSCVVLAVTPSAATASGKAVLEDCAAPPVGHLDKTYSQADYRDALQHVPTDLKQYSNCEQVIRQAQLAAAGGGAGRSGGTGTGGGTPAGGGTSGGAGTGGGAAADPAAPPPPADADAALQAATPQQRAAVTRARTTGAAPISVDGAQVSPSALDAGRLEDLNTLPTPVVVALILLGLGTAAGGGAFAQHVVARRRRA